MYPTTVNQVANFFLTKEAMTHKKLQKLTYYAYSWFLALEDRRLFENQFEAWIHGPVCTELYAKYRNFGWQDIPKIESHEIENKSVLEVIENVYESYGHLDGDQLEYLTHQEEPWVEARNGIPSSIACNSKLDDVVIRRFYLYQYEQEQND
jgi:uncharacterized phage-associated protein